MIDPGGTWKSVRNSGGSAGFRPQNSDLGVWPAFKGYASGRTWQWSDAIPAQGSPTFSMLQTPDSGASTGWRFPLLPAIVIERTPVPQILGEMDNVKWAGTLAEITGQAVSEDVYNINGDDYLLFQQVNRTDHWSHVLVKRE